MNISFIVNGTETIVGKISKKSKVIYSVNKALTQTGNNSRPIHDWQVIYDDTTLHINETWDNQYRKYEKASNDSTIGVNQIIFPSRPLIFVCLRAGQGA